MQVPMNRHAAAGAGYQAPAVQKAFEMLKLVSESKEDLGLSEMADRLGYSKSTTHGLIRALLAAGALAKNQGGRKFFLGPAIVELAFKSWNYFRVIELAQPHLDELRDRIGETVFLGVLSRTRAVIVAISEANKPLKISSPPGVSIPVLAGAVGKVFLARMDPAQAQGLIRERGLPAFTSRSIVDPDDYMKELDRVRRKGYALDDEEYLPGVKAVAVSLGNHRGLPLAVWVVGFAAAMDIPAMPRIVAETLGTAKTLQTLLRVEGA